MKRSVILLLPLCLLLSFSACSSGNVTFDYDSGNLIYNGVSYVETDWEFYNARHPGGDEVELGKTFNLPFSLFLVHSSYTAEDPLYIIEGNLPYFYLKEGFVVEEQAFTVEGSDRSITLAEAFLPADPSVTAESLDLDNSASIDLYMVDCPTLRIHKSIFFVEGSWYMEKNLDGETILLLSDDLVSILNEVYMLPDKAAE